MYNNKNEMKTLIIIGNLYFVSCSFSSHFFFDDGVEIEIQKER